ncbi:MAG: FAD-dependent monooxygenase [Hyphomicrobium sp.]
MTQIERFSAAVIGGGPAGLAAALALARYGIDTALVASPPREGSLVSASDAHSLSWPFGCPPATGPAPGAASPLPLGERPARPECREPVEFVGSAPGEGEPHDGDQRQSLSGPFGCPPATGPVSASALAPERQQSPPDTRTAALFAGSVQFLVNLGVWAGIAPHTAPITAIRIIDDTGGLLRAPETSFTARDAGRETFGINVPNQALTAALWQAVSAEPRITLLTGAMLEALTPGRDDARLRLSDGREFGARLVVAADGRNSICRAAAGIETTAWSYEQSAIACTFAHSRAHHDISTELHRPAGPLTTVPMPGRRSSLVWVERPDEAKRLKDLDEPAFRAELEPRLQGLLGSIGELGPRTLFPLSGLTAKPFGQSRVALVGEAGHVIPPIGAQGLNLGLRDAATIADGAADAIRQGRDPGGDDVLTAYSAARMADVTSRVWTVDVLNRSLLSGLVPVQLARGAGLTALKMLGPLRRALVREGLQPSGGIPRLMRDEVGRGP